MIRSRIINNMVRREYKNYWSLLIENVFLKTLNQIQQQIKVEITFLNGLFKQINLLFSGESIFFVLLAFKTAKFYFLLLIFYLKYFIKSLKKPQVRKRMSLKPELDTQITMQFISVINAQAKLIDKLLHNQKHLFQSIRTLSDNQNSPPSGSVPNKKKADAHNFNFQNHLINQPDQRQNLVKAIPIQMSKYINRMTEKQLLDSEMSQDQLDQSQFRINNIHETKNVIKNFSKSLFRFIQKHRVFVSQVLEHLDIKEEEFHKMFQRFKGKIHTIKELKFLWMPQGNYCHKAFRIISLEYLRKHILNHTFNSRVINYKIHLKYRKKIYEILQNPQEFSSIKYE